MAVPNTPSVKLSDVINEVKPSQNSLEGCFTDAIAGLFDPIYAKRGTEHWLSEFRNYGYDPYHIFLVNIKTRPWYSGTYPPTEKINKFELIYFTGEDYNDSSPLNLTKWVKWQSDDSDLFSLGADNHQFVNTQRPKVISMTSNDLGTMMSPGGLYFYLTKNAGFCKSVNPNITISGSPLRVKMLFDLVAMSTTPPSLSVAPLALLFGADKQSKGTNILTITADGDWYIICPSWLSLSKYWGSGNDTVTVTVDENNHQDDIETSSMSNAPAKICAVTCYGAEIKVSYNASTTTITDTTLILDQYKALDISGTASGIFYKINLSFSSNISDSGTVKAYYRKNGGSWIQMYADSFGSGSGSFGITGLDYDDTIDIRLYAEVSGFDMSSTITATLTGGSITSPEDYGTVVAVSPNQFTVTRNS